MKQKLTLLAGLFFTSSALGGHGDYVAPKSYFHKWEEVNSVLTRLEGKLERPRVEGRMETAFLFLEGARMAMFFEVWRSKSSPNGARLCLMPTAQYTALLNGADGEANFNIEEVRIVSFELSNAEWLALDQCISNVLKSTQENRPKKKVEAGVNRVISLLANESEVAVFENVVPMVGACVSFCLDLALNSSNEERRKATLERFESAARGKADKMPFELEKQIAVIHWFAFYDIDQPPKHYRDR